MKSQNISRQLIIAILLSLSSSICMQLLPLLLTTTDSFKITLILNLSFYIIFILADSPIKTGKLITTASFFISLLACYLLNLSQQLILTFSLMAIFFIRIIYYQETFYQILLNAFLIIAGFIVASFVLMNTNSWLLSAWCFFLFQILLAYGTNSFTGDSTFKTCSEHDLPAENFQQTIKQANQLIQKLLIK